MCGGTGEKEPVPATLLTIDLRRRFGHRMKPNRFSDHVCRTRIAACVTHQYPVPDQAGVYRDLDILGAALEAEVQVFHSAISDPEPLDEELRSRVGRGFFVPPLRGIHRNDLDYFRAVEPERTEALLSTLAVVAGKSVDALLDMFAVPAAFSYARWMRGWGARYVHSWYLYEQSFNALVAAHLLGIPRGITLYGLGDGVMFAGLLEHHVRTADVVVAGTEALRDEIEERFGPSVARRTVLHGAVHDGEPAPVRAIRGVLRSVPQSRVSLGPQAAFVRGSVPRRTARAAPRPLLVLGAERTGSNMLTGMLSSRRDVLCAGELFNPRFIRDGLVPWRSGKAESLPELDALRRSDPGAFLERLFAEGAARGDVATGFKLLYFHGVIDDRIVDWLFAEPTLCVIHLRRRARLLRWVSHSRAAESGSWYADKRTKSAKPPPVELDLVETLTDFSMIEIMEDRYAATFSGHSGVDMDYEDAAADVKRTSRLLGEALGVDLGRLKVRSAKQGRDDLAGSVANLDSLRAAVRGTRFAPHFGDQ